MVVRLNRGSWISPNRASITLSPRPSGGEGKVRGADVPVCGAAHLTLPLLRDGPFPLPPEGWRGASVPAGIFLVAGF